MGFLTEIHALGVPGPHQQGIDTTTPAGKALFQMMGVFAEFERAMIQERVKAGLERAKAQGKQLGRPSTELEKVEAIKAGLRAGGVGIMKLAKLHGVGVGTVQRIKAAMVENQAARAGASRRSDVDFTRSKNTLARTKTGRCEMQTWIFQGNPDQFDVDGYLATWPTNFAWLVTRYGNENFRYRLDDDGGLVPHDDQQEAVREMIALKAQGGRLGLSQQRCRRRATKSATWACRASCERDCRMDSRGCIRKGRRAV